jgi:LuxR family transcriptional regulator
MHVWQEDLLTDLENTESEEVLFGRLAKIAYDLGFDHFAYGLRQPIALAQPKVVMLNNYPDAWKMRYMERNYVAIDPTVHHGTHSVMPLVWTERIFQPEREFWEEARSFGLNVGWAQSSRDMQGVSGMLTLARSTELLTSNELDDKGYKMIWLTQITHQLMAKKLVEPAVTDENALSGRELEVLRWTAEGKTSGEISMIMNITERTVNFHINNCMRKLDVTNKTSAAVKAALLGLLS